MIHGRRHAGRQRSKMFDAGVQMEFLLRIVFAFAGGVGSFPTRRSRKFPTATLDCVAIPSIFLFGTRFLSHFFFLFVSRCNATQIALALRHNYHTICISTSSPLVNYFPSWLQVYSLAPSRRSKRKIPRELEPPCFNGQRYRGIRSRVVQLFAKRNRREIRNG